MSEPDFGVDLFNDGDLDPAMSEVTGFTLKGQAVARRLDTPAGTLVDDDDGDYGEDIAQFVSAGMTKDELDAIPARLANQARLEDGITACEVKPTLTLTPEATVTVDLRLSTGDGPFELTLAATEVSKKLLKIAEAT